MFRWADFEKAAPELATRGIDLIGRFGFVLLGTIRRDGTPRISPIEARVVKGHLMLVIIGGTHKARDVLRDPRLVLNTPVTDAADPGCEFKLRALSRSMIPLSWRPQRAPPTPRAAGVRRQTGITSRSRSKTWR